jgi:beta-glucanase (GH16 family)
MDRPPPPVPPRPPHLSGSAPPVPPRPPQTLWRPALHPSQPIAADWEPKLGNGHEGWGNWEAQHYTASASNVFFVPGAGSDGSDGVLVLRAISRPDHPDPAQKFTSARLVSRQTLALDRGFLTADIRLPCAAGIWPAFWLLPREPFAWPGDGEVDIAETWNADGTNRSCLHWGFHDREPQKHRVAETRIPDMAARPVRFAFGWDQATARLVWWVDGRPVMRARIPEGTRPLRDWCVLLNVAMGGNVCQGRIPDPGAYEMAVSRMWVAEAPEEGWGVFEQGWNTAPEGKGY